MKITNVGQNLSSVSEQGVKTSPMEKGERSQFLTVSAWVIMLLSSILPHILWFEWVSQETRWLFWVQIIFLGLLAATTFVWTAIRPLRKFIVILLGIFLAEELVFRLTSSSIWVGWFEGLHVPFTTSMMGIQLGRLMVSLLMMGLLLALGYRRPDFSWFEDSWMRPLNPCAGWGSPNPSRGRALAGNLPSTSALGCSFS